MKASQVLFGQFSARDLVRTLKNTVVRHPLLVRRALVTVILLGPAVVVSAVLAVGLHASLLDCYPTLDDEVFKWNEIAGFARGGLNSGYFVFDEKTAPLRWSHFGPQGPGFAILYGSLGRVFGWHWTSGPFFNLALMATAASIWAWYCAPNQMQLATAALLSVTFWPALMYLPSTMQEGLHCAIAFLLAGLASPQVNGSAARKRSAMLFVAAALAAAAVRATWALVLIPYACSAPGNSGRLRQTLLIAFASVVAVGLLSAAPLACSPFPSFASDLADVVRAEPAHALELVLARARDGIVRFVNPVWGGRGTPIQTEDGYALEVLLRYQAIAILLAGACVTVFRPSTGRRPYVFAALNLALVLIVLLCVYDVVTWRAYCTLAPHVLLSLLVLLPGAGHRLAVGLVLAQALFVPAFLGEFQYRHVRRLGTPQAVEAIDTFAADTAAVLHYEPGATPWDNTILIPLDRDGALMLGVPQGFGVAVAMDKFPEVIKSKYVLSPQERVPSGRHWKPLNVPVAGTIYLNLDRPEKATAGVGE